MNTSPFWKNTLVATDLSDDSFSALWEARRFLEAHDALEVGILHVTGPAFEGLRIHTTKSHREIGEQARQDLQGPAAEHFPHSRSVTTLVKEGHASGTICETERSCGVDAMVIATHGRTGLKQRR